MQPCKLQYYRMKSLNETDSHSFIVFVSQGNLSRFYLRHSYRPSFNLDFEEDMQVV